MHILIIEDEKGIVNFLTQGLEEEDFVISLNRIGSSFSKHYQFDITNPQKYKVNYKLERMFPRKDLSVVKKQRRFTRKIKREKIPKTGDILFIL